MLSLTDIEQEYFDFILNEFCPYHAIHRRELFPEGGIVLFDSDLKMVKREVGLIEQIGAPVYFADPKRPSKKDKKTPVPLNRSNPVIRIFNVACKEYNAKR